MSEPQEVQFNQRITNSGILFIISGLLTFFALNVYAPYSYFAEQHPIDPMFSFFYPALFWNSLVLLYHLFLLAIAFRFFSINKEITDLLYRRFSLLFLSSIILSFSIAIVLFILGLMPESVYLPFRTEIGLGYLLFSTSAQIIQIMAWIIFYKISRNTSTQLGKDISLNFMNTPLFLILADLIAIGAFVLSFIASRQVLRELNAAPFDKIGTFVHIIWIILTSVIYIFLGIRILIKPNPVVGKGYTSSKQVEIKKVISSCPNCREPIFEDQNVCYNCGYRMR